MVTTEDTHLSIYPSTPYLCMRAKSLQSCLTLCDPTDYSPQGSSIHEISQAIKPDWVALLQGIFPTRGSNPSLLRLLHWQEGSLSLSHLGSPRGNYLSLKTVLPSGPNLAVPM